MPSPIEVKGHTGQVTFDGIFVTILRKGFRARSVVGKGEKKIPLASITATQWKPAGAVVNGFIQFTIAGGVERRSSFGKQTTDAGSDENSVVFTRKQMPAFEKLREAIDGAIMERHLSVAALHYPPPAAASQADELGKMAALHQSGVLSDDEFAAAKARLLGI